ncbi:hypothetical protein [Paenibacillus donghaensis]|uniref:Uncharacterized protein n=1 Tax=Paenibacillus donghaensis TaxID=414771 RepID=A0A2Z2KPC0_9BACL|nr:hypothetical protein [Paenibacillus donghaensis]ASA25533.1 hypothetical protein B9T62_35260 [Paenibacillus donghaensis]
MNNTHALTTLQYLAMVHQVSYTKVCKDLGVTPQQFSDWVKKRRPVPEERLSLLADYFKIAPHLLIGGNHYLRELTTELKLDIQLLVLEQQLEAAEDGADQDGYREKLAHLRRERAQAQQVDRFTALLELGEPSVGKLCAAFLDQVETGNTAQLEKLLLQKEEEA